MSKTNQAINNTPSQEGVETVVKDLGDNATLTTYKENGHDVMHFENTSLDDGSTVVNLMTTTMKTGLVENKTYAGYLAQIKTNLMIHGKAMFLVCRDLYDAKVNLIKVEKSINQEGVEQEVHKTEEYDQLIRDLKISESTETKYLAIGSFKPFLTLFNKGLLPNKWTTLYYLTTLTQSQIESVYNHLRDDISVAQINKLAKVESTSVSNNTIDIVKIAVDKDIFDTSTSLKEFKKIVDKVLTKAFAKYETDNVEVTYNEKLEDICRRLDNKNKPKPITPAAAEKSRAWNRQQNKLADAKTKSGEPFALDAFLA